MNLPEIFQFSFEALMSRKLRSILTILMVMAGSSLLNAVNAFGAALTQLYDNQFSNLVPNIMLVTSSQPPEARVEPASTPPPQGKITLNGEVINRIKSLPFVDEVIPAYQSQLEIHSKSDSRMVSVLSIDPKKHSGVPARIHIEIKRPFCYHCSTWRSQSTWQKYSFHNVGSVHTGNVFFRRHWYRHAKRRIQEFHCDGHW